MTTNVWITAAMIHECKDHDLPMQTGLPGRKNVAPHQDERDGHADEIGKYDRDRQHDPLAETDPR